jgi:glycosyltransferase involved in cell wall biosynthesis
MSETAVSVVIPLYNKERYIDRALRSILTQNVQTFEIIVIDDGSTDSGPAIVESYGDERIRLIRQGNAGVSAARNRGIAEARHDWIAFLDADDEWKPHFLETIAGLRDRFPDAGAYGAAFAVVMPNGESTAGGSPRGGAPHERLIENYFKAAISGDATLHVSTLCVPRHVFVTLGAFTPGERLGEDLELFCKIGMRYPIAYSERVSGIYYRDVVNSAIDSNIVVNELPVARAAREAIRAGKVPQDMVSDLTEYVAEQELWYIRRLVLTGHRTLARTLLRRCETSRYILRKMWWGFWAALPSATTRVAYKLRSALK